MLDEEDISAIRTIIADGLAKSTKSISLQCKVPDRILEKLRDGLSDFKASKIDDMEYALDQLDNVFQEVYDEVETMREACSDLRDIAVERGKALREIDDYLP